MLPKLIVNVPTVAVVVERGLLRRLRGVSAAKQRRSDVFRFSAATPDDEPPVVVDTTLLFCEATHELVSWYGEKGDPCWVCGAASVTSARSHISAGLEE